MLDWHGNIFLFSGLQEVADFQTQISQKWFTYQQAFFFLQKLNMQKIFIVTSSGTEKKLEIDRKLEKNSKFTKISKLNSKFTKISKLNSKFTKISKINSKFIAILNSNLNSKFSSFLSMVDELNIAVFWEKNVLHLSVKYYLWPLLFIWGDYGTFEDASSIFNPRQVGWENLILFPAQRSQKFDFHLEIGYQEIQLSQYVLRFNLNWPRVLCIGLRLVYHCWSGLFCWFQGPFWRWSENSWNSIWGKHFPLSHPLSLNCDHMRLEMIL